MQFVGAGPGDENYVINLTYASDSDEDSGCDRDDVNISYYDQTTAGFGVRIITGDDGAVIDDDCDAEFMFTVFDFTP